MRVSTDTRKVTFSSRNNESNLSSFLLKLLDCPLVDATTLVDEVACGGGLAGVDMSYHHNVYVELLLPHSSSPRKKLRSKQRGEKKQQFRTFGKLHKST